MVILNVPTFSTIAIIDDGVWETDNIRLADILKNRRYNYPDGNPPEDPYPDLTLAMRLVEDWGAEILKEDPPPADPTDNRLTVH